MAKYKRILLKLSGESLMGKQSFGIDPVRLGEYAQQIKEVHEMGVQIGIVIGGGNIFRGLSGLTSFSVYTRSLPSESTRCSSPHSSTPFILASNRSPVWLSS